MTTSTHPDAFEWSEEHGGWPIRQITDADDMGWVVFVQPMLYNERIVLEREDGSRIYEAGWCYDRGQALIAALAWDPVDPETPCPPGFKKEAFDSGLRPRVSDEA